MASILDLLKRRGKKGKETKVEEKMVAKKEMKKDEKVDEGLEAEATGEVFTEAEAVNKFAEGLVGVQDLIAPAAIEVDFSHSKMNERFFRTLFVLTYPNILPTSWLANVINLEHNLDISTFYYPIDSRIVMQKLRRKISEFQATLNSAIEEGKLPDPSVKVALEDAERLQDLLAKNEEKYFHYGLYITVQADSLKELNENTSEVEQTLGTLGIVAKPASLEMEQAFKSTIPTGMDNIYKTRNMSTDAISATFPFVTSNLTMDKGVLFGLNRHNNSLVVFDRFSLENANMVVFAKSGAGKSYMVKLEIYRSLMLGAGVIVIDPEREYEALCDTVGGSYISFSQTGADKINPFELSGIYEEGENELGEKKLFLLGMLRLMLGGVSPEERAILDKALALTYQEKGITDDPATHKNTPPLMEDLYKILKGMAEEEAHKLATRLEMFIKGSASGIFDRPTSVDLNNPFTVFSIQELSDELRPIAMYMMLDYVWTRVRKEKSKRLLVVDEAWYMMQSDDSARFLYWFAKRARKYFLGVTTITQDVEDFLDSKYGKAIVTNSSIQVLMKQSTAAVEKVQKVFNLSDGEKMILLNAQIGEGLFFAGQNHVRIQVVSSEHEHGIVSTDPREKARLEDARREQQEKEERLRRKAFRPEDEFDTKLPEALVEEVEDISEPVQEIKKVEEVEIAPKEDRELEIEVPEVEKQAPLIKEEEKVSPELVEEEGEVVSIPEPEITTTPKVEEKPIIEVEAYDQEKQEIGVPIEETPVSRSELPIQEDKLTDIPIEETPIIEAKTEESPVAEDEELPLEVQESSQPVQQIEEPLEEKVESPVKVAGKGVLEETPLAPGEEISILGGNE